MTNSNSVGLLPEDRALVLSFQHGELNAFRAIYERHHQRAVRICRRMLNNPEDVKEAVQETFLRVYTGLKTFNGSYLLGAWITRIAANVCLDILKARSRRPLADLELAVVDTQKMSDDALNPETVILGRAERRRLGEVLHKLPPHQRAAILLRDFEGLSYAEVAAALGITEGQTKALIHRARQAFKRTWKSQLLTAILPARFLDRLRSTPVEVEHKATSFVTSASNATQAVAGSPQVVSCASALQQCGQFVSDRVAPALTAIVIGTAGAALTTDAPVARSQDDRDRVVATDSSRQDPEEARLLNGDGSLLDGVLDGLKIDDAEDGDELKQDVVATTDVTEPDPSATPPAEEAAPVDDPAPPEVAPTEPPADPEPPSDPDPGPPEPTGNPDPSPTPTEQPPPAEPQGFTFDFVADVGGNEPACNCVASPVVQRETARVSSAGSVQQFDQFVTGYGTDQGTPRYEVRLEQVYDSGQHRMRFELETRDGNIYTYSASGSLSSEGSTDWGGVRAVFTGTYSITARPGFDEPVPEDGSYTVSAQFSVKRQRAVSVSIVLH